MTSHGITIITVNSVAAYAYEYYLIDATNNNVTLTLPAASDGILFGLRRIDSNVSNTVSIVGDSSGETIDGNVALPLLPGDKANVVSINTVWYTVD